MSVTAGCGSSDAERPGVYALALHVHGSLSEGPASMAAHDRAARDMTRPVDVIWWTDHGWRVRGHTYLDRLGFERGLSSTTPVPRAPSRRELDRLDDQAQGVATPGELARMGIEAKEEALVIWAPLRSAHPPASYVLEMSDEQAFEGDRSLLMAVTGGRPGWQGVVLRLQTARRRHVAPLAAGVRLRMAVWPASLGRDAHLILNLVLSQQPGHEPARIEWVLHGPGGAETAPGLEVREHATAGGGAVRIARRSEDLRLGGWNELELDVSRVAVEAGLGGADASLQGIELRMEVKGQASARVFVDDLQIVREAMGEPLFAWQATRAAELSDLVPGLAPVVHHVGQEISYAAHLNAYGPDVPLVDLSERPNGLTPAEAVRFAHAHGGIVSINHPFGVDFSLSRRTSPAALTRLAARMQDMADRRAWDADLLEVGYRARGRDLQAHLDLWDTLSRAGVRVTGIGTSDTHDARIGWGTGPNDFVTWVHARSSSQPDLMDGLRAGRAVFGDPARFAGRVELAVPGRGDMGAVLTRSPSDDDVVEARVSGLRDGQYVVWVEDGERIPTSPDPTALTSTEAGRWQGVHRVRSPGTAFVRLEVHDAHGPVALTNPIYFIEADASPPPGARHPAERGGMLYPWADAIPVP